MESVFDDGKQPKLKSHCCGICGDFLGSDYKRCPFCSKLCHTKCSERYFDESIDTERFICKECHRRIRKELEEKKNKELLLKAKIILVAIAVVIVFLLVKRWF